MTRVKQQLQEHNPTNAITHSALEVIWEAIARENNWQPFIRFLQQLRHPSKEESVKHE